MKQRKQADEIKALDEAIQMRLDELAENRYAEAEAIMKVIEDYPGSTTEEILQLFPTSCADRIRRGIAWLCSEEEIYCEGEFLYASESD